MSDGVTALCRALADVGVECVFGLPGTQTITLFESLRQSRLRTVLATDELKASFMANGYFRATGKVAALVTIPGPGFTYALTGLAEARLDSVGLLFIVGKAATQPGRRFQLQAVDQRAIAAPLVKGIFVIDSPDQIAAVIVEAHQLAVSGEPGPVMVQLDLGALSKGTVQPTPLPKPAAVSPDVAAVATLGTLIRQADRPVLLLGQGAAGSAESLRELCSAFTIPVFTTPSGRGIIPEDDPLALGFDPLRGHLGELNAWLDRADLIVGLGCKLGHNGSVGFGLRLPADRFVHVDASPEVLEANYPTKLAVRARVEDVLSPLQQRDRPTSWKPDEISALRSVLRATPPERVEPVIQGTSAIKPSEFFADLRRYMSRDALLVLDSGLHQILSRRHFDVLTPRGLLFPSDFQSMGFGLPAAIGAKLASPNRQVAAVVGDGGFLMSGMELLSARREKLPITVIVFNDGHLNQIRLQQHADFGRGHAVDLLNPDYEVLAGAFGVDYLRFGQASPAELRAAFSPAGPVLIEVVVGDSMPMRRRAVVARTKNQIRGMVGARAIDWIKARLRNQ